MKKYTLKKYEYSYGAKDSSININALLISQLHFTTIINEIAKNVNSDIELNIRVVAPKEGSFVFQQVIDYVYATNLLSRDNV